MHTHSHARPARPRPRARWRALAGHAALLAAAVAALVLVPDAHARRHADAGAHHRAQRGHVALAPDPTALGLRWYDLTRAAVVAAAEPEQVTQNRIWAVSWLAAARAVREHRDAVFRTAAFATALHDTLATLVPSQSAPLDAALADALASVPAGPQRAAGVAAGRAQAAAVLAQRAGDGLDTASVDAPWVLPAAAPGVYQLTPPSFGPVVRAGLPKARSFLLEANDALRPGPPPSLTSARYLRDLAEVHAYGSATSSVRTPAQTDVATFVAQPSVDAYVQVLRATIADAHRSLAWQTRVVAAFNAIEIDQQIAVHDAKFAYVFWRPVTAIRTGAVDPDPSWTPLLATPRHPEYPSGHAGYAGTAEVLLRALVGPRPAQPIALTSPTAPGAVRTYARWSALTQEVIDGRVWEGVHFRFSDEAGARLGAEVARYDLARLGRLWR